jgi:hypothetical protein
MPAALQIHSFGTYYYGNNTDWEHIRIHFICFIPGNDLNEITKWKELKSNM